MEKEKRFVGMSAECAYVENKTIKTIAFHKFSRTFLLIEKSKNYDI